jgi:hypothetical protein
MIRTACVGLPILSAVIYFIFPQPVLLVLIGALGQGVMLPFLAGVAVYFHHRHLAAALGTSRTWTFCLWLAALSMAAVGAYQITQTVRSFL